MNDYDDTTTDTFKIIENLEKDKEEIPKSTIEKITSAETDLSVFEIKEIRGGAKIDVELGDIVELCAPDNPEWNQHTFFVEYVDIQKIKLIDIETLQETTLSLNGRKQLVDSTIIGWSLLSRETTRGYARLYGLVPKKWINIYFEGELPTIIIGQITNLEEDLIEITPIKSGNEYPEPIYIDFAYKGIPEELSIYKIVLREEPSIEKQLKTSPISLENDEKKEIPNIQYLPTGEVILEIPENFIPQSPQYSPLDFEEEEDEIKEEEEFTIYAEIPENERIYGIEIQTNELLDKMFGEIPKYKRTPSVLQNIHNIIERYKQLRKKIYIFDSNGFVQSKKPFVSQSLSELNKKLNWIFPIIEAKKKIYYSDEIINKTIPSDIELININENLFEQEKHYTNDKSSGGRNVYEEYLFETSEFQRPFLTDTENSTSQISQDILINNTDELDRFQTSIARTKENETRITNYSFFVQRVLEEDPVQINGLMILPESVRIYSKIDLHKTNILQRSELSQTFLYFFRLFKSNIASILLNEKNRLEFKELPFQVKFPPIMLNEKETLFANTFPKTEEIISKNADYLTNKVSLNEFIRLLEPYLIYNENINRSLFFKIKDILQKKITETLRQLNQHKNIKYKEETTLKGKNTIENLIKSEDFETTKKFEELLKYYFDSNDITSSELLYRIHATDSGELYFTMISYILYYLITPVDKLVEEVSKPIIRLEEDIKIKSNDCARKVIAKKYTSKKELEKDNGQPELYFDKELDDTPYDIYKQYEKERKRFREEDFREYLKQNLIDRHHCPPNQADELVETFLQHKKLVREGEYAVLQESPKLFKHFSSETMTEKENKEVEIEKEMKTKYTYYKRNKQNEWILDISIQDERGELYENFCENIKNCKKNPEINTCEPSSEKKIQEKFIRSIGEKANTLKDKIDSIKSSFIIKKLLVDSKLNDKYQLGEEVKENTLINQSPLIPLRQLVLSEQDFARRQLYIIRFYTKYCREADKNEDPHWGYCRQSNTKLFPKSLYELASAFIDNNYQLKLDELIYKIGEKSTDGDAVIDKYTGYVLKRVDDSTEEGYDDRGFKITTNAILETDTIDVLLKELKTKKFDNPIAEKVYKVFHHLKIKTGLKDDDERIENFVLTQSVRFLCNSAKLPTECLINTDYFDSEEKYIEKQKKEGQKTKKQIEKEMAENKRKYATYLNRVIINVSISMYLIAIQTNIPGIKPRKTFPHCVYSYNGFPMDSNNDLSGITFLACIVKSTANDKILLEQNNELWKSLETYKIEIFIKNIELFLNSIVVSADTRDEYLFNLYRDKRAFLSLQQTLDTAGSREHDVKKWTRFLPPIVNYSVIKSLKYLDSDNFKTELNKNIVHGNKQQHENLNIYKSKIMLMTYALVERIRNIIHGMKTPNLLIKSFIQNACCNETNIINPILYFAEKDPEIKRILVSTYKYAFDYNDYSYSKAKLLYFAKGQTPAKKENKINKYSKELIYATYIHYCHYDNNLPMDADLADVCSKKPENYNKELTLSQKISVLEKANIIYNEDIQIHRLMKRVFTRNIISFPTKDEDYSILSDFVQFLGELTDSDSELINKTFIKHVFESVESCHKKTQIIPITDVDNEEYNKQIEFIDFLARENRDKHEKLISFFKKYNIRKTKNVIDFMNKIKMNDRFLTKTSSDNRNYSFVKNSIKDFVQIFPQFVINKKEPIIFDELDHWQITKDRRELRKYYNNFYSDLNSFFDVDNIQLHTFLNQVTKKMSVFIKCIELLPIYSHLQIREKICYHLFSERTINLILKYLWYSVLETFVKETETEREIINKREKDEKKDDEEEEYKSEYEGEIELEQLQPEESKELKNTISHLLQVFVSMEEEILKTVDYNYASIKSESLKQSEREKDTFIEKIGKMNKDEKKLDKMMRRLKLGNYYVDTQAYKNPDFFAQGPIPATGSEPIVEENQEPFTIDYGTNVRDINANEDDPTEEVVNPQYDPDDVEENNYGEVEFDNNIDDY
jgi:hypothetical protein